jgi:hypothetical protein
MTSNAIQMGEVDNEDDLRRQLVDIGGIWQGPLVDRIDRIALFGTLSTSALMEILDQMIKIRRKQATVPLPVSLDDVGVRQQIVGDSAVSLVNIRGESVDMVSPMIELESPLKMLLQQTEVEVTRMSLKGSDRVQVEASGVRVKLDGGKFRTERGL